MPSPPQRITVLAVSPRAGLRPVLVRAGPERAPYATVSAAVKRTGAVVGVNGFFETPTGHSPMLVEDGRVVRSTRIWARERHPRTAIGLTSNGFALFVAVDGRRATSIGMTVGELAALMRSLRAVWAVNLDGGASTTMVARGAIRNRPSDPFGERLVPTAVVLIPSSRPPAALMTELGRQLHRLDDRIALPPSGGIREGARWAQRL